MSIEVIKNFVEDLKESPDKSAVTFYHYTNTEGLVGILNSQELWLTDSKFLNDPSEKQHGLLISELANLNVWNTLMSEVIASIEKEEQPDKSALHFLDESIKRHKEFAEKEYMASTYLMSFCEDGDLLSQWKGYSNYGKGFSIGFKKSFLSDISGFHLGRVIYSWEEKIKILEKVTINFIDKYKVNIQEFNNELLTDFFNLIGFISIFFKDYFFKEENEWRLVSVPELKQKPDCKATNSGVTPFIKIQIKPLEEKIDKIILGPKYDSRYIYSLKNWFPIEKIELSKGSLV